MNEKQIFSESAVMFLFLNTPEASLDTMTTVSGAGVVELFFLPLFSFIFFL
jgi:hypothetical protein